MRISEKCSCGASIEVDSANMTSAQNTVKNWRADHIHTMQPKQYPYVTYGGYTATNTAGAATTKIDPNGLM